MTDSQQERLYQQLIDDGYTPDEAQRLAEVSDVLDTSPTPTIYAAHQQAVITQMLSVMPRRKSYWEQVQEWYPIAVLYSQLRIIHNGLWGASAFVLILGVLVTLMMPNPDFMSLSVLAPIVAAAGVAVLYDDTTRAMLDIEDATRADARMLLFARMTLVFGFNLLLMLLGSVILAAIDNQTLLLPLVASWLAPMTFLAGLAFFLSIITRDSLLAAGASLVLWLTHLIMSASPLPTLWLQVASLPGLSDPSNRPLLLVAGLALMVVAIWMVGIIDRQTGQLS